MPYTCVYIYTHIHVSCFWSKFVYLHSPAKVAVFGTWQSTYTHSLLTEIKSMLYLVSSSSFRGSVSKMFFNLLFLHGLFPNPPSPPIFFSALSGCIYAPGFVQIRRIFSKEISWLSSLMLLYSTLPAILGGLNGILDKKPVLQPQRAPTAEGTSGALHWFFTVQILHRSALIAVN